MSGTPFVKKSCDSRKGIDLPHTIKEAVPHTTKLCNYEVMFLSKYRKKEVKMGLN